jgi:Putative zinc-finger
MTHPEEHLAGYVDGTLEHEERAVVDAHLGGCERCRDEIELARSARTGLVALEDVPVPYGLTDRVLAEAGRRFERRKVVVWERLQWAAGLAAAAALVLVVVLNVGGERDRDVERASTGATAAAGAPEAAQDTALSGELPPFQGLEEQRGVGYDDAGVESIARDTVQVIAGEAAPGQASTLFAAPDEALACIARSDGPVNDPETTLVRLIQAEYEGTPAYIAVFAEGPGAGQPASTIVIWVASEGDCRLLSAASLRF